MAKLKHRFAALLLLVPLYSAASVAVAQPMPGWQDDQSIISDGRERFFRYLIPSTLPSGRVPLVIYLHGGGGSMREAMTGNNGSAHWPEVAEQEGFILLAPNGVNRQTGEPFGDDQHWNDCRGDSGVAGTGADDVRLITDLIDWAAEHLPIDTRRVYVNGSSNGGMMSFRLADEAPGRFAAVASFIANQPAQSECSVADQALPMMIVVGTEDPLMPFAGGVVANNRGTVLSADETRDLWVRRNRLEPDTPTVTQLPDLDPEDWSVIRLALYHSDTSELRYYVMEGGGHAMPSIARRLPRRAENLLLGPQNHDLEGAAEAWAFFSRFETEAPENAHSLSGLWYDPTLPGDGFNLVSDGVVSTVTFYGADDDGEPLWLISEPLLEPMTVGRRLEFELYRAEGGTLTAPADPENSLVRWGTLSWHVLSCRRIEVELLGDGGGEKSAVLSKLLGIAGADC